MIALSTAPMPMKGIEEARAIDRLETGCSALAEAAACSATNFRSALMAASNSDLQSICLNPTALLCSNLRFSLILSCLPVQLPKRCLSIVLLEQSLQIASAEILIFTAVCCY